MKKLIGIVLCFTCAACILTGCRSRENQNTTDTTTTPSTVATMPTTSSTIPTTEATQPSAGSDMQNDSTMPNGSNGANERGNGGTGNSMGGESTQSRAHYPSIVGGNR